MPYLFLRVKEDDDAYAAYVAIGADIVVRAAPTSGARKLSKLNWDIVFRIGDEPPESVGWLKIKTPAGKIGFVQRTLLRSPVDYRIIMESVRGKWLITNFVAGD